MPAYDRQNANTWHRKQRQHKTSAEIPACASASASGVLSVTSIRKRGFSELFSSCVSALSAHVLSLYRTNANKTLTNSGLARARVPYIHTYTHSIGVYVHTYIYPQHWSVHTYIHPQHWSIYTYIHIPTALEHTYIQHF